MKIARVKMSSKNCGRGTCEEVRGLVEAITMQLPSRHHGYPQTEIQLKVKDKWHTIDAAGFPRIDVSEEVILHLWSGDVVALQVVRGDVTVFRVLLPRQEISELAEFFKFEGQRK